MFSYLLFAIKAIYAYLVVDPGNIHYPVPAATRTDIDVATGGKGDALGFHFIKPL